MGLGEVAISQRTAEQWTPKNTSIVRVKNTQWLPVGPRLAKKHRIWTGMEFGGSLHEG